MKSTSRHHSSVVIRCGLAVAQVLLLLGLTPMLQASPAVAATNQVTGVVFEDFNNNGVQDTGLTLNNAGSGQVGVAVDQGVGGVTVTAYDASGAAVGSTTSVAPSGAYTLSIPAGSYRIEFSGLPAGYVPGQHGANNGTSVQFSDGVTPANFGILQPGNYCQNNPEIFVNCYRFGDQVIGGNRNSPGLYSFPYNAGSDDPVNLAPYDQPAPLSRTVASRVGTTYGMAWARSTKRLYASAFFKKHAGFGPGADGLPNTTDDPGAIYVFDPTTNTVVNVFTVPNATSNAHDTSNGDQGYLLDNGNVAWAAVYKSSLGGLALSPDESRLFVMNMENRTLYALSTSSGAVVGSQAVPTANVPLPAGTCAPSDVRPYAVEVHQGLGYLGLTCTAESTQLTNTLRAYVYTFTLDSLAIGGQPVFQFPLDYPRGIGNSDPTVGATPVSALWSPWSPTFTQRPERNTSLIWRVPVYPQPILASLSFDTAGNLELGLRDRFGDQMGNEVPSNPAFPNELISGVTAGDVLRACGSPATGWTLENNARCGVQGAGPQNNGQGPGNGEYYWRDQYMPFHEEVSLGSVFQVPGYPDVVAATYNPIPIDANSSAVFDGGFRWYNNATGGFSKGYRIYDGDRAQGNLFGKAAGLGDVAVLCDEAPIELGNRVWNDTNNNGRQDPGELPIAGVTVGLYDAVGTLLNTTTTAADGTYYFTATNPAGTARILPNTSYSIRVDATQGALTGKALTTPNSVAGGNGVPDTSNNAITDVRDSDAAQTGNFAIIPYTTGAAGATNHGLDFGFATPPPAALGDYVWIDRNRNGLQDEPPSDGFNGLTVSLLQNGSIISTTTTADKNGSPGYYLFDNLTPGTYSVCFQMPSGYTITPPNQGSDDTIDSDADVTTGCTPTVTLAAGDRNLTIDMGLQTPPEVAGLGDFVWLDLNKNGLQDTGEPGVPGVTVTLYNQAGTAMDTRLTNASGYYSFTDLVPATYSVCFTAPPGYTFTLPNVGNNDAIDSDANPATGCTPQVTLAAGEFNPTLDAGLITPLARLGDFVWHDLNKNGIQDTGEPGVPGVTVTLRDGSNNVLSTTVTNGSGLYLFDNLQPGSYIVCFTLPTGFVFSPPNQGGNDAIDSDADMVTGCASTVTLQPGESNLTIDAGIYQEVAAPALAVSLSGVPQNSSDCFTLQAGDLVTYTAVVTNIGGAAATGVIVTNTLPANTLFVNGSSTPPPAGTTAMVITWNAGALNPGQSATIQYSLRVTYTAAAPTAITNQVQAGAASASTVTSLPVSHPVGGCTAVTLAAFTAELQNRGVKVVWKTALEANTFGFYVLRSATGNRADAVKVSETMLTANGANSSYSLVDEKGQSNTQYWLQEIELSGAQNEHGPIKVAGVIVQPQPQPSTQTQPVVNPVGGSLVAGGGVPVASLQSPVAQQQSAQQPVTQMQAQSQPQATQAQPAQTQAQVQPAQAAAVVNSPLNTATQPQAQAANATTANDMPAQPAPQVNAAQPAQQQPVAVAEVQSAQPANQQPAVAQPAKNVQAVGANDAVEVARGGQAVNAPALTTTAQPASAQSTPWAPIAAALSLLGLGAAGAFVAFRRKTQK